MLTTITVEARKVTVERLAQAAQLLPAPATDSVPLNDPARGTSVWKVPFVPGLDEEIAVTLPHPALPLGVDWEADGRAVLWMQVGPGRQLRERRLIIVQTSREGLPPSRYVGTLRNPVGCFFHVFELC